MRLLALVATLGVLAAACGSGSATSAPTVTLVATTTTVPPTTVPPTTVPPTTVPPTTVPPTTVPPTEPPLTTETIVDQEAKDRAEIEEVVQRFHAYTYEVGFVEGVPGFEELATSPILERGLQTMGEFADLGYGVGEGDHAFRTIEIRFLSPNTAEVEGCRVDEAPVVDKAGNEVTDRTPDPAVTITDVQLEDGVWRVSEFHFKDNKLVPCEI